MFDCSREFNKFYNQHVVLSQKEKNELRDKRHKNVKRLKEGLKKYNSDKNKSFKVAETRTQGSMAMHTIVQNDKKDYDIDIAVVFESDNLDGLGPLATRNMVANALKEEMYQFSQEPEVKTSCIRVRYTTGYHIDFAIFKRSKDHDWQDEYSYEHAGSEWSFRDIKGLENWFVDEVKDKGCELRKIVRLSKMFCKSRDTWGSMPSGLIQTILCAEQFDHAHDRIDERFYHTMKSIVDRLKWSLEVNAPVDNSRALTTREVDRERILRWKNKLDTQLDKLDVLFDDDCTYEQAMSVWNEFFNHSYWIVLSKSQITESISQKTLSYDDTEQFIEDIYPVSEIYNVEIDCKVSGNGFREMPILQYLMQYAPGLEKFIPPNFKVKCRINYTDCPSYDRIFWKVRNVGEVAERKNCIRGQIKEKGQEIIEPTSFRGTHFIECYLIKDEVCVAIGHITVPIGEI